ncbi:hypothetical protein Trydic_g17503 [Trypoxylus dichotomus]
MSGFYIHLESTSVLFVSITFIVLMIISLAWLVFYYIQRLRNIHAKDKLSRKLCNAAKKALSKIPTKTIKSEDREVKDGECCAVCIEPYKPLEVLRILPCTHEFHKNCIDPWLLEHRTCPMCKMDILKHYGFMFTDSQESILQVEIDDVVGGNLGSPTLSTDLRTEGRVTPSSQVRAETASNRQLSFDSSADDEEDEDNCSRASSPQDTTDLVLEHRPSIGPEDDVNCELHSQLVEPLNRSSHQ